MTCIGSLSCQSFGPQPFQIFAQRDLLLLVFGQRAIRWTEYVVGVIFAFTHDVTLSNCRVPAGLSQNGIAIRDEQLDRKQPRLEAAGWWTGAARPLRDGGLDQELRPVNFPASPALLPSIRPLRESSVKKPNSAVTYRGRLR